MFINGINISPVSFGFSIMDSQKGKGASNKPKTEKDEFVKSSVVVAMRTLPNFEDEGYESIEGKNIWVDDTKRFLKSHPSQSRNVVDSLAHMIYGNSFLKDLKDAKKNGDDVSVYVFFEKASKLLTSLYMKQIPGDNLAEIEDGLDLLEYSYEYDSLAELANKKDNAVFLDDFVSLGEDDLSEEKRTKIEEDLRNYFDESFLVAPNPVLTLEMQFDKNVSDNTYIEAFKKFLTMSREAADMYKDEDN